jgi:hypothetical protein
MSGGRLLLECRLLTHRRRVESSEGPAAGGVAGRVWKRLSGLLVESRGAHWLTPLSVRGKVTAVSDASFGMRLARFGSDPAGGYLYCLET